jgi:hypothetical protein
MAVAAMAVAALGSMGLACRLHLMRDSQDCLGDWLEDLTAQTAYGSYNSIHFENTGPTWNAGLPYRFLRHEWAQY